MGCAYFFTALYIYSTSRVWLLPAWTRTERNRLKESGSSRWWGQTPEVNVSAAQLDCWTLPHLEGQLGSGFWTSKEQAVLAIVSHGCQMCNSQLAVRAVRNDHRCPILRTVEAVLIVWLESRCVYTVVQIILCHSGALTYWISNKRWIWLSFHLNSISCSSFHHNSKSLSPSRNDFFLISCSIRCRHVLQVVR